ncbi:multidrug efflux MFS transporter [Paenibacillus agilis]|uniref:Multidrug efflux MFS transporter n=2 Tax=Paenibacillus agilis TaxID=3020863 RepID=A0A559IZC6_9BACL|nr:multidrug efflux MFS transporter [Paenibacillus agilis]
MSMYGISGYTVMIPIWKAHWGLTVDYAQWSLIGFMAAAGVSMTLSGYMVKRWGIRRVLVVVTALSAIASVVGGLLTDWGSIVGIRIVLGLCAGMITPLTVSLIYQYLPEQKRALAMGWWSMAAMLGPAVGPVISGWLYVQFGWSSLFLFSGLLSMFMLGCLRRIPRQSISTSYTPFPLRQFILAGTGSASVIIGLSQVHYWIGAGWGYGMVALAGGGMLVRLVQISAADKQPLLHWPLFKYRLWTLTMLWNGIVTLALYAGTYLIPLYLMDVQGWNAADSGWIMLFPSFIMVLLAPVVGRLYDVVGPLRLMFSGLLLMLIGSLLLASLDSGASVLSIISAMFIRSVGVSLVTTPGNHMGMVCLANEHIAQGSALSNWLKQLLSACSIAIYSSIVMLGHNSVEGTLVTVSRIQAAFWVSIVFILMLIPIWWLLRNNRRQMSPASPIMNGG